MIAQLAHGEVLREALGKYLSRAARDAVEQGQLELGGTTMSATVLFSDIRGFTTLSEKMEPEHVLSLLNRYFTEMVGAVVRHRGIVDKFIGDCIMAVWGPPHAQRDDAMNAIHAALGDAHAARRVESHARRRRHRRAAHGHRDSHRAGGGRQYGRWRLPPRSKAKMEYTVIGDTVNFSRHDSSR